MPGLKERNMEYETGDLIDGIVCRSSRASYEDGLAYLYTIFETVADTPHLY